MYNKIHYIVPLRDDFSFTNDNSQNILYENIFVKELSAMPAKPLHRGRGLGWVSFLLFIQRPHGILLRRTVGAGYDDGRGHGQHDGEGDEEYPPVERDVVGKGL